MNEILKIVEVLAEIPLIREFFQSLMIIYLSYESIIIFIDIPKYIKINKTLRPPFKQKYFFISLARYLEHLIH